MIQIIALNTLIFSVLFIVLCFAVHAYHMKTFSRKAKTFATKAHEGQIRKYTAEPYINHPVAVAKIVADVGSDNSMIAAALLHDVVEDTDTTIQDIIKHFGINIASMVSDLTDVSKSSDGNRKARKEIDREHTRMASPSAKTIKLADMIDNMASTIKYDPEFAKVYIAEKKLLLEVLLDGNAVLYYKAFVIIERYYTWANKEE